MRPASASGIPHPDLVLLHHQRDTACPAHTALALISAVPHGENNAGRSPSLASAEGHPAELSYEVLGAWVAAVAQAIEILEQAERGELTDDEVRGRFTEF